MTFLTPHLAPRRFSASGLRADQTLLALRACVLNFLAEVTRHVLPEDLHSFVEDQSRLPDRHQRGHALLHALRIDLFFSGIRSDQHVGVHDMSVHSWILLSICAFVIAAISPISSPKKSLGQFFTFPRGSSSSGTNSDWSLRYSQK